MKELALSFIPMFVVMDPVGELPLYISLAKTYSAKKKNMILYQSLITAFLVALIFILIGKTKVIHLLPAAITL